MTAHQSSSKTVPFHAHVTVGTDQFYGSMNYSVVFYEGGETQMGFRYRKDAEEAAARINAEWGGREIDLEDVEEYGMDGVYEWYKDKYTYGEYRPYRRGEVNAYPTSQGIVVNLPESGDDILSDAAAKKLLDDLLNIIDVREV